MKTTCKLYKYALALLLAVMGGVNVWGQRTTYDNINIQHKTTPLWSTPAYQDYFPRTNEGLVDSYDEANLTITVNGHIYQNTHTYTEYIYVNPGESVDLVMPSQGSGASDDSFNYKYYQRWYDYDEDDAVSEGTLQPLNANGYGASRGYIFANGLVGGKSISNDYSEHLWQVRYTAPANDSFDEIRIACDASRYNDADNSLGNYSDRSFTEPTLSIRCIYVIRNANQIKQALNTSTYYEDYEIHYPTERKGTTDEVVSLAMNARNYFAGNQNGQNANTLEVTASSNINLTTKTIYGNNRVIRFSYDNVSDEEVGTIEVKNGNYLVARYTIVFDQYTEGRTETQVNDATGRYAYRRNAYFEAQGYELLNQINFEYQDYTDKGDFYPYPVNWTYNTYGFFANSTYGSGWNEQTIRDIPNQNLPQSAEYTIMHGFHSGTNIPDGNEIEGDYHLYVDASDKPGTVVKARLRENLCPGARMYVTAWIKNQGWGEWGNDPREDRTAEAGVVFVLKGVMNDGTETEIYRHASGQIKRNSTSSSDWHQIYFSYTNVDEVYDYYTLQIDNNCASSSGGDIALDDIRIYMAPLNVEGETVNPICSTDKKATVKMSINYDMLLARLGLSAADDGEVGETLSGHYSFLNKGIYDQILAGNAVNYERAFEAALIQGSGVYGSGTNHYGTFTFSTQQNNLEIHDDGSRWLTIESTIMANSDSEESGTRTLIPGETYYIAYYTPNSASDPFDEDITISNMAGLYDFNGLCGIKGEFTVAGHLVIKINGEAVKDILTSKLIDLDHYQQFEPLEKPLKQEHSWFALSDNPFLE